MVSQRKSRNQTKKYERALSSFDKAIEADPRFAAAYNGKAIAYNHLKKI